MQQYKNGAEISITPIEIQILKKLYDNKNYIVSTESLCDTIWGVDSFGYETLFDCTYSENSRKIEENPSKPQYLKTAKGLGYKLLS
ncbi:MAG: helix-turn-helix domain-containing protein [Streptococcus salivarius]